MDKRICAFPAADYSTGEMDRVVAGHFAALNADTMLKPGMRVCIKPNLLMKAAPDQNVTTHPELVAAVIRALRAMGITDIVIGESPGGPYTKSALEGIYKATGMTGAVGADAALNFDTGYTALAADKAVICRAFNVINPVANADAVINLPKLKTHGMVMLSAGVKNLLGCVPGLQKPELHFRFGEKDDFCRMLVDLALLIAPCLTIVDAVDAMEGNGPSAGAIRHTGMTFAAVNPFALDLALCRYTGMTPDIVPTVRHAIESGLCPASADELDWISDAPAPVGRFILPDSRPHDFSHKLPPALKKPFNALVSAFFTSRPAIEKRRCIGCGKCSESCAPGAVTIHERKAVIDYKKCIACYCCHEMCPVQAVKIKRSRLFG
ncbi:MAG: DUF362 domain-containing protein [Oscillospiraceae bacterium]|nr:DUF362 domain-containing protein [Oscillospiraceae bacterium]